MINLHAHIHKPQQHSKILKCKSKAAPNVKEIHFWGKKAANIFQAEAASELLGDQNAKMYWQLATLCLCWVGFLHQSQFSCLQQGVANHQFIPKCVVVWVLHKSIHYFIFLIILLGAVLKSGCLCTVRLTSYNIIVFSIHVKLNIASLPHVCNHVSLVRVVIHSGKPDN